MYVLGYLLIMVPWVVGVATIARRTWLGMCRAWCEVYRPMIERSK